MRVAVITAAWRRRAITRICYRGARRTAESARKAGIQLELFAAASSLPDYRLAQSFGFDVILCANRPLGRKHNMLMAHAARMQPDYFLQIGSDNLLRCGFWQTGVLELMRAGAHLFGFNRLAVFDSATGRAKSGSYLQGFGAGRFISYEAAQAHNFELWGPMRQRGLDGDSAKRIARRFGFAEGRMRLLSTSPEEPLPVLDIKSSQNLNPYSKLNGEPLGPARLLPFFPEIQPLL
jgi:hypothetical protein